LTNTMRLADGTVGIADALADPRLLRPDRYEELVSSLLPKCDDWAILGHEFVYRGWLTPHQVNLLGAGRGAELILGSYVLLEPIGEGGMGRIYRARNWKFDSQAAVKVIRTDRARDPGAVSRFLREIRALGAIRHPHIVHALDADVEAGRLYYAMEHVGGTDLGLVLRDRGALPVEVAGRYAAQLASGLQHISALGLVHRDVKPCNILVTSDGSAVKLLDLGLARFDRADEDGGLTQVGMMIGTPDYVAPEQIRDSSGADIRADLYSLGCTLYHMLAGRPPFDGLDPVDKLYHQQHVDPVPVEQVRPDVPARLAQVVRTLLAKKARDRYQDPAEVVAALGPYLQPTADTVTDAAAPTAPAVPVVSPDWALARTEEIPIDRIPVMTPEQAEAALHPATWMDFTYHWMNRLHWLIAAVLAGLGMGLVLGRG
jgi:serine/threonine protein kinase